MTIPVSNYENLPQVVISPRRNEVEREMGRQGTVGRTLPSEVQERATTLGKGNTPEGGETGFWGEDGFSFGDLIDLINPLQHIPVVSTIYRAVTGDEIGIGPRLLGGAVLGGVVGFGLSALNAAVEYETGKDVGQHALAAAGFDPEPHTAYASAQEVAPATPYTLSAADPMGTMLEAVPEISTVPAAQAAQDLALEQNAISRMAQTGIDPILLEPLTPQTGPDPRAVFTLGGMEKAAQRYQQAQMSDKLQDMALGMDIEG